MIMETYTSLENIPRGFIYKVHSFYNPFNNLSGYSDKCLFDDHYIVFPEYLGSYSLANEKFTLRVLTSRYGVCYSKKEYSFNEDLNCSKNLYINLQRIQKIHLPKDSLIGSTEDGQAFLKPYKEKSYYAINDSVIFIDSYETFYKEFPSSLSTYRTFKRLHIECTYKSSSGYHKGMVGYLSGESKELPYEDYKVYIFYKMTSKFPYEVNKKYINRFSEVFSFESIEGNYVRVSVGEQEPLKILMEEFLQGELLKPLEFPYMFDTSYRRVDTSEKITFKDLGMGFIGLEDSSGELKRLTWEEYIESEYSYGLQRDFSELYSFDVSRLDLYQGFTGISLEDSSGVSTSATTMIYPRIPDNSLGTVVTGSNNYALGNSSGALENLSRSNVQDVHRNLTQRIKETLRSSLETSIKEEIPKKPEKTYKKTLEKFKEDFDKESVKDLLEGFSKEAIEEFYKILWEYSEEESFGKTKKILEIGSEAQKNVSDLSEKLERIGNNIYPLDKEYITYPYEGNDINKSYREIFQIKLEKIRLKKSYNPFSSSFRETVEDFIKFYRKDFKDILETHISTLKDIIEGISVDYKDSYEESLEVALKAFEYILREECDKRLVESRMSSIIVTKNLLRSILELYKTKEELLKAELVTNEEIGYNMISSLVTRLESLKMKSLKVIDKETLEELNETRKGILQKSLKET